MTVPEFPDFPDNSTLWVYAFAEPLDAAGARIVSDALAAFIAQWNSHGDKVHGTFTIYADRFALMVSRPESTVSGCSIDSTVRLFKALKAEHGLDGLASNLVYFRSGDQVLADSRSGFKARVAAGEVTAQTLVYDLSVTELGALRQGRFELALADSWHARAFLPATAKG